MQILSWAFRTSMFCLQVTATALLVASCGEPEPLPVAQRAAELSYRPQALLPGSPQGLDDYAQAVAISGNTAIVGATQYPFKLGQAYVFLRSGSQWSQQALLQPMDDGTTPEFGRAVAIAGDTAVVGAPSATIGGVKYAGAVYVFTRSAAKWSQQALLTAPAGLGATFFGSSLTLTGDTLLVGAPNAVVPMGAMNGIGRVYEFGRSGTQWTLRATLSSADGKAADQFGNAVALAGDTAVVGANYASTTSSFAGKVYVFVRSGASWTQQAMLTAANLAADFEFGSAVAIAGDTLLVGESPHASGLRQVSVFTRSGTSWTRQESLLSNGVSGDKFGGSLALVGELALIGAYGDNPVAPGHKGSGTAYMFVHSGTSWTRQEVLQSPNAAYYGSFGWSVALSENADTAIVGDFSNLDPGYAYAFVLRKPIAAACAGDDECDSRYCVDGVCCGSTCGGSSLSDCQACSVAAGGTKDGTCSPVRAQLVCRAGIGSTDPSEVCDGQSLTCPADIKAPSGSMAAGCSYPMNTGRAATAAESAAALTTLALLAWASRRRRRFLNP